MKYRGREVVDGKTLCASGVGRDANLQWEPSLSGGAPGTRFADVSVKDGITKIMWSKSAPKWRRADYGLCLEGKCTNSSCEAFRCDVIMPVGR